MEVEIDAFVFIAPYSECYRPNGQKRAELEWPENLDLSCSIFQVFGGSSKSLKKSVPEMGAEAHKRLFMTPQRSKWWHPLPGAPVRISIKSSNHGSSDSRGGSGLSTQAYLVLQIAVLAVEANPCSVLLNGPLDVRSQNINFDVRPKVSRPAGFVREHDLLGQRLF